MSTILNDWNKLPLVVPFQPLRMTVEEYHRFIGEERFAEDRRAELLRGVVVEKMPRHPRHSAAIVRCTKLLNAMLPDGMHLRTQDAITLSDSEPEPDLAVVRGVDWDFASAHPGPNDVPLVIEVASTSLVTDRFKAEIYAEAGIPTYWIVNLPERVIEVFTSPQMTDTPARYAEVRPYQPGEQIPVVIDGVTLGTIAAAELLP